MDNYYSVNLNTAGPAENFIKAIFSYPGVVEEMCDGDNPYGHKLARVGVEQGKLSVETVDGQKTAIGQVSGNVVDIFTLTSAPAGLAAAYITRAALCPLGERYGVEGKLEFGRHIPETRQKSFPLLTNTLTEKGELLKTENWAAEHGLIVSNERRGFRRWVPA